MMPQSDGGQGDRGSVRSASGVGELDVAAGQAQTRRIWCPCFKGEHFELLDDAIEGEQGAGWLFKRGNRFRAWVRRWFVLKDAQLYYFKDQTRALHKCRGTMCLINATVQEVAREGGRYTFEVNHRHYETKHFSATSKLQMDRWVRGLNEVIEQAKVQGSRDGFLMQRTGKSWQNRWVVVHSGEMRCYEKPKDPQPALAVDLRLCELRRTIGDSGFFAFELSAHAADTGRPLRTEFAAEDYTTRERWIEALYKQSTRAKQKLEPVKSKPTMRAIGLDDDEEEDDGDTNSPASGAGRTSLESQGIQLFAPSPSAMPKDEGGKSSQGGQRATAPLALPHPFLSRSLSKRPSSDQPPDALYGYMLKKTAAAGANAFQKRYFELRYPGMLYYYRHKPEEGTHPKPKGIIALVDVIEGYPRIGKNPQDVLLGTSSREYHIRCAGREEAEKWCAALREWAAFALLCSGRLDQQQQAPATSTSHSSLNNTLNALLLPAGDKHEAFRRLASTMLKEDGAKAGVV